MDEHYHLVPILEEVHALVIADLVHVLPLPHGVHLLDTNECLGQGNWTKSSIKEEQTNVWIYSDGKRKIEYI